MRRERSRRRTHRGPAHPTAGAERNGARRSQRDRGESLVATDARRRRVGRDHVGGEPRQPLDLRRQVGQRTDPGVGRGIDEHIDVAVEVVHNLTAQMRALDAAKTGAGLDLLILLALASAMLRRSMRDGLIAVGDLSLGGGIETALNAAAFGEHAMEKGASVLLLPVSARRQLLDVSDEVATIVSFILYRDAQGALLKALEE